MLDFPSTFFAAVPPGLEPVLFAEIKNCGFENAKVTIGGVSFTGDFEALCSANLRLRTASRILLRVGQFFAAHVSELHKKSAKIPWEKFLLPTSTIDVRASCRKSKIYHSEAAAERVARGIADRLKLTTLPTFGDGAPDEAGGKTTVLVRIERDHCTVSLDTTGAHLHRRGYRLHGGIAPLRENLAAAVLYLCGWSFESEILMDPMCGSGTIPIEGALMAADIPPGIFRSFAFESLPFFDRLVFEETKERLLSRIKTPSRPIIASDIDADALRITIANAHRAQVAAFIEVSQKDAGCLHSLEKDCFVISNPPYGKRIGERRKLRSLYQSLRNAVSRMERSHLAIVSDDASIATQGGMDFKTVSAPFPNGGIRVQLFSTKIL